MQTLGRTHVLAMAKVGIFLIFRSDGLLHNWHLLIERERESNFAFQKLAGERECVCVCACMHAFDTVCAWVRALC